MSKKMKKFLDFEVKAAHGEPNTYWFTASTDSRDRQGDIIVQDGWKTADFMKNPVILWAHNYYETPIGKGMEVSLSNGKLAIKVQFVPEDIDPFAGKVEKLVANNFLRTGSVGFMVYKREPLTAEDLKQRPEMKYGERLYGDLLEFSIVPVPANPEALNENGFADVISRGFGLKQDEAQSKFLPYRDEKGAINPRLLRASLAAALGARGGVKITDVDESAAIRHLYRIAKENGIEVPRESHVPEFLKEAFKDVWHDELLEVIHASEEETEAVSLKLIKGERRKRLIEARDALNAILILSEVEEPNKKPSGEPEPDLDTASMIEGLTKDLSSLTARLK